MTDVTLPAVRDEGRRRPGRSRLRPGPGPGRQRRRGAQRPRGARRRGRSFDSVALPWLLLLPALVIILGLVGYPIVRTFWISFHAGTGLGTGGFTGIDQYRSLAEDSYFRAALLRTAYFSVFNVVATMVVGLLVALVLDALRTRGRLLGVIVLLPWAMPRVASGIVWKWMFDAQYGTVNWALNGLGLHQFSGYAWFNSGFSSLVVISAAWIWQSVPFIAIALLAGLRSNPQEILDAASVDGAGYWRLVFRVRLPMLRPLLTVLLVMSTIWAVQAFDYFFVMTVPPGGPDHSTEVLSLLTWLNAFPLLQQGRAAAIAVITFVILALVTIAYVRAFREETS